MLRVAVKHCRPRPHPPPAILSLSTSKVTFKAPGPFALAPPIQTITGTATGLTNSGGTLFRVSDVMLGTNSGQANVIPVAAPTLVTAPIFKADTFQGSITVSACLNDQTCQTGQPAGSPQHL